MLPRPSMVFFFAEHAPHAVASFVIWCKFVEVPTLLYKNRSHYFINAMNITMLALTYDICMIENKCFWQIHDILQSLRKSDELGKKMA